LVGNGASKGVLKRKRGRVNHLGGPHLEEKRSGQGFLRKKRALSTFRKRCIKKIQSGSALIKEKNQRRVGSETETDKKKKDGVGA